MPKNYLSGFEALNRIADEHKRMLDQLGVSDALRGHADLTAHMSQAIKASEAVSIAQRASGVFPDLKLASGILPDTQRATALGLFPLDWKTTSIGGSIGELARKAREFDSLGSS